MPSRGAIFTNIQTFTFIQVCESEIAFAPLAAIKLHLPSIKIKRLLKIFLICFLTEFTTKTHYEKLLNNTLGTKRLTFRSEPVSRKIYANQGSNESAIYVRRSRCYNKQNHANFKCNIRIHLFISPLFCTNLIHIYILVSLLTIPQYHNMVEFIYYKPVYELFCSVYLKLYFIRYGAW